MFSQVLGFVSKDMAIDLGTANTLVYVPGRGIVLDEPSVVAVTQARDGERKVIAVGREAKTMLGRTPSKIETIQPLRDGVIADFAAAEEMIKHFIRRVQRRSLFSSPRIMICVPASATPVERRAVHEAGLSAGARRVYLIEEPVAAAIGAGLPISETRGSMIVDIGGGTTDIAVLSMGDVIYSHSIRTAGNAMDEAIVNYVRFKHHLLIGSASAEAVKKESGSALAKTNGERVTIHMKGRDLQRGFPTEIELEPQDIAEALEPADPADRRRHPPGARRRAAGARRRSLRFRHLPHGRRGAARTARPAARPRNRGQVQDRRRPFALRRAGNRHGPGAARRHGSSFDQAMIRQ